MPSKCKPQIAALCTPPTHLTHKHERLRNETISATTANANHDASANTKASQLDS